MTMVPAPSLSKRQQQQQQRYHLFDGRGVCYTDNNNGGLMSRFQGYEYCISEGCLGSDTPMAEDESRTNSLNEAAGSSSKDNNKNNDNSSSNNNIQEERDESWLQLGIGAQTQTTTTHERKNDDDDQVDPTVRRRGLIELDLLSGSSCSNQGRALSAPVFDVGSGEYRGGSRPIMGSAHAATSLNLLFQQGSSSSSSSAYQYHLHQYHQQRHQEINWAFRPMPHNYIAAASSSSSPNSQTCSSSGLMPLGSYLSRPFQVVHGGIHVAGGPSTSSDFRVIDPPRRPISGIWFSLHASLNQAQEPFLPQISKSYLRIKDGRMTVRLLMKYLVNKLRLDSESEVEITCRGQQLLPFLTLQHVRDNIWSSRDTVTLLPDSSTADHVMVLQYGRSAQK